MFKKWFGFGKKDETPETEDQSSEQKQEEQKKEEENNEEPKREENKEESKEEEHKEEEHKEEESKEEESKEEESKEEESKEEPKEQEPQEDKPEPVPIEPVKSESLESFSAEVAESLEEETEEQAQGGFFSRLFSGLDKTRKGIVDKIDQAINNYGEIDESLYDEIEEILISADVGMDTTLKLVEQLREEMKTRKVKDTAGVHQALAAVMERLLIGEGDHQLEHSTPAVYLVIGVNGAGKTTSIGKMAKLYQQQGKKVLLAAADTFRAAAIDQLKAWADRTKTPLIAHQEGSDPAAVVFDGIQAAKARGVDILICDTAGRLHNKKNLMNELAKIFKIVEREWPEAHREVLLVLDATTGQNAVQQARLFKEVADISGIILTKLDGTARGGVVLAIRSELNIPVKLIGVGEGIHDLQPFVAADFVRALMDLPEQDTPTETL